MISEKSSALLTCKTQTQTRCKNNGRNVYFIYKKIQNTRHQFVTHLSQFCPSTNSLHLQMPLSGRHSAWLLRLPARSHWHGLTSTQYWMQRSYKTSLLPGFARFPIMHPVHIWHHIKYVLQLSNNTLQRIALESLLSWIKYVSCHLRY